MGTIEPLTIEDTGAFMLQLSGAEQSCLTASGIGPEELLQIRELSPGGSPSTGGSFLGCLEDRTVLRLFITSALKLQQPLSGEASACIAEELDPLDLRHSMGPFGEEDIPLSALAASIAALNATVGCLTDAEWSIYGPHLGAQSGEREAVGCIVFEALGGPARLQEAIEQDRPGAAEIYFEVLEACGDRTLPSASAADEGANQPSPTWSFATDGWITVAPVVWDGVIYIGSDDGQLYALTAETGELLWSFATGDRVRSTPNVTGGRVYFGSDDNHLYALQAATGQELWRFDTRDTVRFRPVVGDGMVFFPARTGPDRSIHAVDADSGEIAWVSQRPYPIVDGLVPTLIGNRLYVQGAEYGAFYVMDPTTGEVTWQAEVGGYVESAPTVVDGVVYLTVINQAYAFSESTGDLLWSVNTEEFPAIDFPATLVDGIYFLASGEIVHALNAATGESIWRYDTEHLGSAPVVADGVLYRGPDLDGGNLIALNVQTGELLWSLPGEGFSSYPVSVVDGVLYSQLSQGSTFAVDAKVGEALGWEIETGGFSNIRMFTVEGGVVYWARDNKVYAAPAPTPIGQP